MISCKFTVFHLKFWFLFNFVQYLCSIRISFQIEISEIFSNFWQNHEHHKNLSLSHEGCNSILSTTNLNTTATSNFHSTQPKKYGCTALELLKIVQECEKILENEQICGPDWTNQMKKRWYTEKMPFWVVVNADLSFLNGRYDNCTFDLARLDSLLESAKYFDKPEYMMLLLNLKAKAGN